MNDRFYDPIVAEVRKNREELLAEFDGDIDKLHEHLAAQRPKWEAAGFRYETENETQARLARRRRQEKELAQRVANL